jgi:hypothetical protein
MHGLPEHSGYNKDTGGGALNLIFKWTRLTEQPRTRRFCYGRAGMKSRGKREQIRDISYIYPYKKKMLQEKKT